MKTKKLILINDRLAKALRAAAYQLEESESQIVRQALYIYLPTLRIPDVDTALKAPNQEPQDDEHA